MSLRLPSPQFDTGCIQNGKDEVLLFGGFNDQSLDTVYSYKCTDPKSEGEITNALIPDKLGNSDGEFFVNNGLYIDFPEKYTNNAK